MDDLIEPSVAPRPRLESLFVEAFGEDAARASNRLTAKAPGLEHQDAWFGRTTLMVQYWRTFEQLEAYAKARDGAHLPAWAAFNRAVGANGDVGIFHETYRVAPGEYENVYANMPAIMFGKVGQLVEASGGLQGARSRMSLRPARADRREASGTAPPE